MAHLSGDQGLINAFSQGKDIHRSTAAEIFGVSLDEVTSEQRRNAKAINFGLIYGMSAFGLSRQLGISRPDAQKYMDLYFQRYPSVQQFMTDIREKRKHKAMWKRYLVAVYIYLISILATQCVVKGQNA